MIRIFFVALLLNLALTMRAWSAAAKKVTPIPTRSMVDPARPEFAGMELDMMGYPTNAAIAQSIGQADARRDITNGMLAIKTFGLPAPESGKYDELLKQRCHVGVEGLAGCCVTESLIKYAQGYSEVADAYIMQKYGTNIFDELWSVAQGKHHETILQHPAAFRTPSRTYTVQAGDTFTKIARKEGVTLKQLQDANPGLAPAKLKIGQKIAVAFDKTNRVPKSLPAAN